MVFGWLLPNKLNFYITILIDASGQQFKKDKLQKPHNTNSITKENTHNTSNGVCQTCKKGIFLHMQELGQNHV